MRESGQRVRTVMRILSAVFLLATAVIHIFLVFDGIGGAEGVSFILNGIAGVVLTIAILVTRGWLLRIVTVLGLVFMVATLLALILALTVGLFGFNETWSFAPVPPTVVVESIGIVVLAVTTGVMLRGVGAARRSAVSS